MLISIKKPECSNGLFRASKIFPRLPGIISNVPDRDGIKRGKTDTGEKEKSLMRRWE